MCFALLVRFYTYVYRKDPTASDNLFHLRHIEVGFLYVETSPGVHLH